MSEDLVLKQKSLNTITNLMTPSSNFNLINIMTQVSLTQYTHTLIILFIAHPFQPRELSSQASPGKVTVVEQTQPCTTDFAIHPADTRRLSFLDCDRK
jgi:hypothetical protein